LRVLFLLILFSIFLLAIKRERISAAQGILLAGFTATCLMAFRNIHLYGIVAPFVLAEALGDARKIRWLDRLEGTLHRVENKISGVGWIVISASLLTVLAVTNGALQKSYQFSPSMFPVQAVAWLEKNPQPGHTFNDLNWGGYLELHLWPKNLMFVDSIADKTGEVTMQYETVIMLSDGWQAIFERHDIQWVIVRSASPLAKTLQNEYGWKILYQDETAVVLRKSRLQRDCLPRPALNQKEIRFVANLFLINNSDYFSTAGAAVKAARRFIKRPLRREALFGCSTPCSAALSSVLIAFSTASLVLGSFSAKDARALVTAVRAAPRKVRLRTRFFSF
jgi:hypothetical protein